jgi:hypothetical protein
MIEERICQYCRMPRGAATAEFCCPAAQRDDDRAREDVILRRDKAAMELGQRRAHWNGRQCLQEKQEGLRC